MRSELACLAAIGLAASALSSAPSSARADRRGDPLAIEPAGPDPLAVLREVDRTWTYEVVRGESLAKLEPAPNSPRIRCKVVAWTVPAPLAGSILECAEEAAPDQRPAGGPEGPRWTRHLVFDAAGVRELADERDLTDRTKTRGLTFPRKLDGTWKIDERGAGNRRTQVIVREETVAVRGAPQKVWAAETTRWPPANPSIALPPRSGSSAPIPDPEVEVVRLLPGTGPVLLCTRVDRRSNYQCLRLVEERPPPERAAARPPPKQERVAIASKQAHDVSTLKAADVAARIASAYLPAVRRCYRSVLAKRATARGALTLAFTVNAVGKTEAITVKGFDETLADCVAKQLDAWRFPIPQSKYAEPRNARFTIRLDLGP